jgi:hypothetical protein
MQIWNWMCPQCVLPSQHGCGKFKLCSEIDQAGVYVTVSVYKKAIQCIYPLTAPAVTVG